MHARTVHTLKQTPLHATLCGCTTLHHGGTYCANRLSMHSTLTLFDGETPAPCPASARVRKGPAGSELCLSLVTFTL